MITNREILQHHLNGVLQETMKQRAFCVGHGIVKTPENRLAAIVRNAHAAEDASTDDNPKAIQYFYAVAANALNAIMDLEKL